MSTSIRGRISHLGSRILRAARFQRGMTITEVLVSITILTIVMLGGLQFFVAGAARVDREAHRRAALGMISTRMEEVIRAPYDSILSVTESNLSMDDIVCTRTTDVTYVDDPQDGVGGADTDSLDYKQVIVTVSWSTGGQSNSLSAETMVSP